MDTRSTTGISNVTGDLNSGTFSLNADNDYAFEINKASGTNLLYYNTNDNEFYIKNTSGIPIFTVKPESDEVLINAGMIQTNSVTNKYEDHSLVLNSDSSNSDSAVIFSDNGNNYAIVWDTSDDKFKLCNITSYDVTPITVGAYEDLMIKNLKVDGGIITDTSDNRIIARVANDIIIGQDAMSGLIYCNGSLVKTNYDSQDIGDATNRWGTVYCTSINSSSGTASSSLTTNQYVYSTSENLTLQNTGSTTNSNINMQDTKTTINIQNTNIIDIDSNGLSPASNITYNLGQGSANKYFNSVFTVDSRYLTYGTYDMIITNNDETYNTTDRTLKIGLGNVSRTMDITADLTLDQNLSTTSDVQFNSVTANVVGSSSQLTSSGLSIVDKVIRTLPGVLFPDIDFFDADTGLARVKNLDVINTTSSKAIKLSNKNTTDTSADRELKLDLNASDRTIDLSGDLTVSGASTINQDVSSTSTPTFAGINNTTGLDLNISGTPNGVFRAIGGEVMLILGDGNNNFDGGSTELSNTKSKRVILSTYDNPHIEIHGGRTGQGTKKSPYIDLSYEDDRDYNWRTIANNTGSISTSVLGNIPYNFYVNLQLVMTLNSGDATFNKNILPSSANSLNIGAENSEFNDIFANGLYLYSDGDPEIILRSSKGDSNSFNVIRFDITPLHTSDYAILSYGSGYTGAQSFRQPGDWTFESVSDDCRNMVFQIFDNGVITGNQFIFCEGESTSDVGATAILTMDNTAITAYRDILPSTANSLNIGAENSEFNAVFANGLYLYSAGYPEIILKSSKSDSNVFNVIRFDINPAHTSDYAIYSYGTAYTPTQSFRQAGDWTFESVSDDCRNMVFQIFDNGGTVTGNQFIFCEGESAYEAGATAILTMDNTAITAYRDIIPDGALSIGQVSATNYFSDVISDNLCLLDSDKSHKLSILLNDNLSSDQTLTLDVGLGSHQLSIVGDSVLNQDVSTGGIPSFQDVIISAPTYLCCYIASPITGISLSTVSSGGAGNVIAYALTSISGNGFSVNKDLDNNDDNGHIRYTGTTTRIFIINVNISFSLSTGTNKTIHMGLLKETSTATYSVVNGSVLQRSIANLNDVGNASIVCCLELAQNDAISLFAYTSATTTDLDLEHVNFQIHPL